MKPALLDSTYYYSAYKHGVSYRHLAWQVLYSKITKEYIQFYTN